MTKLISTLSILALFLLVGCQNGPLDSQWATFTSAEQDDTTADGSLPRAADGQSAELLSAFFGLDDNLPRGAS